jgi:hemerythrin-like metal-binding protein
MDRYGDALALGVESMDTEHHRLAALFEEFADCITEGAPPERLGEIVENALMLANEHFEHEEELAARAGYPKLDEEKFHHRNMRLQITTLIGDTLSNRTPNPMTLDNLATIQRIFCEHIAGPDRELAEYLIANGLS